MRHAQIATTLDRGLTTYQAMLEVLATSGFLHGGNFSSFHRRAAEVPTPGRCRDRVARRDRAGAGRYRRRRRTPLLCIGR